jgi:hypothetical protein
MAAVATLCVLDSDNATGVSSCQAPPASKGGDEGPDSATVAAAQAEADRMIALVRAPAGASAVATDPSGGGPVWESAVTKNKVQRARSWKLPGTFEQALTWLVSYDPPLLARNGLEMENASTSYASAIGPKFATADRTYGDVHRGHWSDASLKVVVSRGSGDTAYLDAVGLAYPLDDHIRRDITPCPRLRVPVDQPCPDAPMNGLAEWLRPGVDNPGQPDLDRMLVPAGTPTGGRICYYGEAVTASAQRVLDGPTAAWMAQQVRSVHLDHDDYDGPYGGLGTSGPGAVILALSYPGRPDVDVQAEDRSGLRDVANGRIEADGTPWGDSGLFCVLTRALPNLPHDLTDGCPTTVH